MSNDDIRRKPNAVQYLRYCCGRPLPDSMREWVRHDLTGKGATRRMIIRAAVPTALILAPLWLLPASFYVHLEMTAPIFISLVFFAHALNKVWRRHMLRMHNLDPDLADERARQRDAHIHRDYIERFGPRSGR